MYGREHPTIPSKVSYLLFFSNAYLFAYSWPTVLTYCFTVGLLG